MDTILTVTDVAEILKVKPITVREMFRDERIRGFKVGKAWRTTETMLQEDIEKLARGEAPDKLPRNNGSDNHAPAKKKKPKTAEVNRAPRIAAKEAASQSSNDAAAENAEQESPQQFLF